MIIEFHVTIYKKKRKQKKYISWIIYKILPKRKIKKQKQKSILKKSNHYVVFVQCQVCMELGGDRGFISTDSLTLSCFRFLSFSDETHSDRNYNDQSKTKTENRENNSTEWIFGIHNICSSADSNCWVVRSPCEHYTRAGIITGSNSIFLQGRVMIWKSTIDV